MTMHYVHLDPSFTPGPAAQQISFEAFLFAGGEPHIRFKPADLAPLESITITHRVQSFEDFGLLLLAVDALQRADVNHIEVVLPYFPGARQDRVMVAGEPLTVKVYADLLNALNLRRVTVYDAHSEVTPAVLNQARTINNHRFIAQVLEQINVEHLVSPDGGALKKIYKLSAFLGGKHVVEGSKIRDVRTGQLSGFQVFCDDLEGTDCLIVDDICDGGGTFMGLAQTLKDKGVGRLYLAVSHGIFRRGVDDLSKHFETIFTTDTFRTTVEHPQLVCLSVGEELLGLV